MGISAGQRRRAVSRGIIVGQARGTAPHRAQEVCPGVALYRLEEEGARVARQVHIQCGTDRRQRLEAYLQGRL